MGALPPATLEGWYALHQAFRQDWAALRSEGHGGPAAIAAEAAALFDALGESAAEGWSAAFRLAGGGADWLFVHFRSTLEELSNVELRVNRSVFGRTLRLEYDYLSVTEAGLYHSTAEIAAKAEPESEEFRRLLSERSAEEAATPHIHTRLYPQVPAGMRYVSFYPMSKRREAPDNWYILPIEERSRLMRDHGLTGRRFAGRVFQIITGSVGLDDWEWGVTLFSRDPLEFKRIVTEMRYDEASARYGEFGRFFTGVRIEPGEWASLMGAE